MSELSYLDELLVEFHNECDESIKLYVSSVKLHYDVEDFDDRMFEMLIEHSVLKLFAKWEYFLEKVFIAYMLGEKSAQGDAVGRFVFPNDENHAYRIVKSVNRYPEWSNVDDVLTNAENFFENSGAFAILRTMKSSLTELKKVRNGIAHISKSAKKDFDNLVLGKLGKVPTGITPAKFLVNYKIGKKRNDPTFFEFYVEYLKNVASLLIEFNAEQNVT